MKYRTTYDLTHITSLEALRREQLVVQARIENRESQLRLKLYELPGELAAAGANSLIPKIFRGRITNAALNGSKRLINNFFAPAESRQQNLLTHTVKSGPGIFSIVRKGITGLLKSKK